MKFEIRNSNSQTQPYYWRIVATNGNVLASSEHTSTRPTQQLPPSQSSTTPQPPAWRI